MRPFRDLTTLDEALRIVLGSASPVDRTEHVPLDQAGGRVTARDIGSGTDVPAFDRAAMDGYAVVAADTSGAARDAPRRLHWRARTFAGEVAEARVGRGECVEVATGSPLPAGADAVVMVEDTERSETTVSVLTPVTPGQNVGRRGADIARGQRVVEAGQLLGPAKIGALAAVGTTSVEVFARPTVAILSTGNEVVAPGQPLGAGQIYDVNRFTIDAVVRQHGGIPVSFRTAGDTLDDLFEGLDRAAEHDIVVLSGGSSVGDRDLVVDAVRARGEVLLHGIAVKPGKPTLFGRIGRARVFGMPGYPASCLSNAYILLLPLLRLTARLPRWRPHTEELPLARPVASAAGRHQFYPVRVRAGRVEPAFKASGDITSLADADGYIEVPVGVGRVEEGTTVRVTYF